MLAEYGRGNAAWKPYCETSGHHSDDQHSKVRNSRSIRDEVDEIRATVLIKQKDYGKERRVDKEYTDATVKYRVYVLSRISGQKVIAVESSHIVVDVCNDQSQDRTAMFIDYTGKCHRVVHEGKCCEALTVLHS